MRISLFLILTLCCFILSTPAPVIAVTVFQVLKEVQDDVQLLMDTKELLDTDLNKTIDERKVFVKLDSLWTGITSVSKQLEELGNNINMIQRLIINLENTGFEQNLKQIRMRQVFINQQFTLMEKYVIDYNEYENSTLIDFANNIVSHHNNSVPSFVDFIYDTLTEPQFLDFFSQQFNREDINYFCKEGQSLTQILHYFLNEILMINMKGFTLTHTAYIFKMMYKTGNYSQEMKDGFYQFQKRINKLLELFRDKIASASPKFWKCDPDKHVPNETYIEVVNFLHSFVLNEVNLSPTGNCNEQCEDFKYVKKTQCYDNEWCKSQTTCPTVMKCRTVEQTMSVCSQSMVTTHRRYGYIKFDDNQQYGRKTSCRFTNNLEPYRFWLFWKCSYCLCVCDEGPKFFSERYINLHLTTSNVTDNMVVTGLRFIKQNGIIHLQVQEGRIMEYGQIDLSTIRWVPPRNYSKITKNITEGRDYHKLSWEERSVYLNDITADDGTVITGVRFIKIRSRLYLEAVVTPYNFTSGRLSNGSYFQEQKNLRFNTKFGRELKLFEPDIPTRLKEVSTDLTTDHCVQFTHSDLKKDAGQTTVPFFDAQPVASAIAVPLTGIGLFHRGAKGYGGFIAPRIFTYNFAQHLRPVFPQNTSLELRN